MRHVQNALFSGTCCPFAIYAALPILFNFTVLFGLPNVYITLCWIFPNNYFSPLGQFVEHLVCNILNFFILTTLGNSTLIYTIITYQHHSRLYTIFKTTIPTKLTSLTTHLFLPPSLLTKPLNYQNLTT